MILCINTIFHAGELSTITLDESTIFIPSTNGTSETTSISASTETSIQVTTTTLEKGKEHHKNFSIYIS